MLAEPSLVSIRALSSTFGVSPLKSIPFLFPKYQMLVSFCAEEKSGNKASSQYGLIGHRKYFNS
jgi:hypothetical protein